MSFGKRLCWLRMQNRVPIESIARELGLDVNAYLRYEIEEREPDDRFLAIIADRYEVTTDFLLGWDDIDFVESHIPNQSKEDRDELNTYIDMKRAQYLRRKEKQSV